MPSFSPPSASLPRGFRRCVENRHGLCSRDRPSLSANQDWTRYDLTFNTNSSTQLQLRLGSWGTTSGTAWIDDVAIEEVPLHNLVKTPTGSPLKIYRPDGTAVMEGVDVDTVNDPGGFVNGVFSG